MPTFSRPRLGTRHVAPCLCFVASLADRRVSVSVVFACVCGTRLCVYMSVDLGFSESYKLKTPRLIVGGGLSLAKRSGIGVGG